MSKPVLLSGGNGKVSELAGTVNGQFLVNDGNNDVVFSSATTPASPISPPPAASRASFFSAPPIPLSGLRPHRTLPSSNAPHPSTSSSSPTSKPPSSLHSKVRVSTRAFALIIPATPFDCAPIQRERNHRAHRRRPT